jgi:hypothetical protein
MSRRYAEVDLSSAFTNNGFYCDGIPRITGFSIFPNACFPAACLPPSGSLAVVHGVPFRIPPMDGLNNIECMGQTVAVPQGRYTRIHLLGASETGSFAEEFQLLHAEGAASLPAGLSDWLSAMSAFQERAAFTSDLTYMAGELRPLRCSIWLQSLPSPTGALLHAIRLPDLPAMRLFAVTLEEEGE